jgi:hypothetical protein
MLASRKLASMLSSSHPTPFWDGVCLWGKHIREAQRLPGGMRDNGRTDADRRENSMFALIVLPLSCINSSWEALLAKIWGIPEGNSQNVMRL